LGRIEKSETDAALARFDRNDIVYLDIHSSDTGKALQAAMKHFSWFAKADESVFETYKNSLLITVCLVLVLLYMTMGAQFESFLLPLLLMVSIPFSLAGTGPAMLLFGINLDAGAILGLITLFGLVVNNGLILYEISDQRIKIGLSCALAVYGGSAERLRPVLITTITTIAALIPLLLSPLANSQKSMAVAMMGGVITSALLCLFVLPPVLLRFFQWRKSL
jgi:multidrug efflux pump subunit AcrB